MSQTYLPDLTALNTQHVQFSTVVAARMSDVQLREVTPPPYQHPQDDDWKYPPPPAFRLDSITHLQLVRTKDVPLHAEAIESLKALTLLTRLELLNTQFETEADLRDVLDGMRALEEVWLNVAPFNQSGSKPVAPPMTTQVRKVIFPRYPSLHHWLNHKHFSRVENLNLIPCPTANLECTRLVHLSTLTVDSKGLITFPSLAHLQLKAISFAMDAELDEQSDVGLDWRYWISQQTGLKQLALEGVRADSYGWPNLFHLQFRDSLLAFQMRNCLVEPDLKLVAPNVRQVCLIGAKYPLEFLGGFTGATTLTLSLHADQFPHLADALTHLPDLEELHVVLGDRGDFTYSTAGMLDGIPSNLTRFSMSPVEILPSHLPGIAAVLSKWTRMEAWKWEVYASDRTLIFTTLLAILADMPALKEWHLAGATQDEPLIKALVLQHNWWSLTASPLFGDHGIQKCISLCDLLLRPRYEGGGYVPLTGYSLPPFRWELNFRS